MSPIRPPLHLVASRRWRDIADRRVSVRSEGVFVVLEPRIEVLWGCAWSAIRDSFSLNRVGRARRGSLDHIGRQVTGAGQTLSHVRVLEPGLGFAAGGDA